ncbi:MAG TPA: serine hydrolase, partial [Micromonosporaceae bacterium]|nr:serine hydrolase [Micromonosporaceae bacterium]
MVHSAGARPVRFRAVTARCLAVAAVLGIGACGLEKTPATPAASGPSPATATQPATPQSIGIDPATAVRSALPAELDAYIDAKGGHAGIAVVDRMTGLAVESNADTIFQTASIVKFDILATRLLQHQKAGTSMTANEKHLAFLMITESDNNAASALYALDGGASGLAAANKIFGLKVTTPKSAWGRTQTTPADQVLLLTSVMDPDGPLTEDSRSYILSLMSQVDPEQRWGITAAAGPEALHVYVKNGWDSIALFGGMRGDNSVGRIIESDHDWLIAVMSDYNRTDAVGHLIDGTLSTMAV